MITRSRTKEEVKEHIQIDNKISKERMLQPSSSVAKIEHRRGNKNEIQKIAKVSKTTTPLKHLSKKRMEKEEEVKDTI